MEISPTQITDYKRSKEQLESFWIFCIVVAGRNSDFAARVVAKLLSRTNTPFEYFREIGEVGIHNALVANKVGQYHRIKRAIVESLNLNMGTCSYEDLISIFGVGPKTANFFLLHSREDYQGAVLDTHVLKYLADKGHDVPKSTPNNPVNYKELSDKFIWHSALEYPGLSVAQRDLLIWSIYSGRLGDAF